MIIINSFGDYSLPLCLSILNCTIQIKDSFAKRVALQPISVSSYYLKPTKRLKQIKNLKSIKLRLYFKDLRFLWTSWSKDVFEIIRNILWIHLLDVYIGVHGNADVCVTQPSLNIFQIKPLFVQDTGCAMTQIVKPQHGSEVISLLKTH